jgi:hypothetical protein
MDPRVPPEDDQLLLLVQNVAGRHMTIFCLVAGDYYAKHHLPSF